MAHQAMYSAIGKLATGALGTVFEKLHELNTEIEQVKDIIDIHDKFTELRIEALENKNISSYLFSIFNRDVFYKGYINDVIKKDYGEFFDDCLKDGSEEFDKHMRQSLDITLPYEKISINTLSKQLAPEAVILPDGPYNSRTFMKIHIAFRDYIKLRGGDCDANEEKYDEESALKIVLEHLIPNYIILLNEFQKDLTEEEIKQFDEQYSQQLEALISERIIPRPTEIVSTILLIITAAIILFLTVFGTLYLIGAGIGFVLTFFDPNIYKKEIKRRIYLTVNSTLYSWVYVAMWIMFYRKQYAIDKLKKT